MSEANNHLAEPLTVVIIGASGDLARTKIVPALYALYCQGYLPKRLRVVVEKPFGSDRASSDQLVRDMLAVFTEDQTYRIDHYLGKELIHNLLVLRFANLVFEPIWNRNYIDHVQITWKEDIGVGDRGGSPESLLGRTQHAA